jgi:hypothetical protein
MNHTTNRDAALAAYSAAMGRAAAAQARAHEARTTAAWTAYRASMDALAAARKTLEDTYR